ncbi:ABC transporter permease [Actinophytocola sp.]|uniref:ABC transporter permease n=1 Tax=Actinophytocola sp. TaxID=1872138 RepID=UPI002D80A9B3|nr:ABC transporter permease [Actinophytocola sp.]HET9140974.1 ABC transporter permease [Actinophytocola sp.]
MTGAGGLLRFLLRRERFALPWWLLGAALLVLIQSTQSQRLYDTPEALAQLRQTLGGNTAVIVMSGPTRLLESIGGEVVFEIFAFVAILVALMNMFLVGRHTRADEETGRAELIRSARLGRRAPLGAALLLAGVANLAVAVLVFAAAAGTGLPPSGSLLFGFAMAGVGVTFAGLTAVAAQVFENTRAVYGAVGLAIGAAYALRAAGDVGNEALSWMSPIGWGQRTFPYAGDRWWPLLVPAVATALLVAVAAALLERRDFGAGLVPPRPGRATASRALGSPLGLAWRLQRGTLIGWWFGLFLLGAAYGSIGDTIEQYIEDNPQVAEFLPGGASDVVDAYLALTVMVSALIAAAYGVTSAMRVRGEETSGRAEPVLATATSRAGWLASHLSVALVGSALVLAAIGLGEGLAYGLTVSDAGQIPRMVAVAFVYLPAVWLVIAAAVVGIGWLPRVAAALAWAAVGYCAVIAMFADSLDLPGWLQSASPFTHTPQAPLESVAAAPLLIMGAAVVAFVAAGYAGLRRRDVGY